MKILLVEDDKSTSAFVKRGLEEEGFVIDIVPTGEEGLSLVEKNTYDLVILDIMLPGMNGLEVCHVLRQMETYFPILMLTGKRDIADRVRGLNSGSDDYLIKPFAFEELVARIHALLRRSSQTVPSVLRAGSLTIDSATRQVMFKQRRLDLTVKEYAILEFLLRHHDTVVTRTVLEQHIWNQEFEGTSNIVDVYIKRIRSKIGNEGGSLIQTIRGVGYLLAII